MGSCRLENTKRAIIAGDPAWTAYVAMLQADHWLFVACNAVGNRHQRYNRNSLGAIRGLLAKHLERLQPAAYEALHKTGRSRTRKRSVLREKPAGT